MYQNWYFLAAAILSILLILLLIRSVFSEVTAENFQNQYDKLDEEDKEKINKMLDKMFEDQLRKKESREVKLAKIISSNQWLFAVFMFTVYSRLMSPDEKEKFKQDMIQKFPHLRGAIENKKWPFK